jgi:23S rRNA (uracil1939-C5)-methyltransferase
MEKCSVYKKCSGCQLMNMDYTQQLKWKETLVKRLVGKFGRVNKIIGMENPYHYRNKAQTLFRCAKSGKIVSGVYQSSNNGIVGVESCLLNNKRADRIAIAVKTVIGNLGISIYNPKTGKGYFKHTLIRTAYNTGENLLVLVTAKGDFPKKEIFVKELLKLYPKITTIVHNINPNPNKMMLGEREEVLYGKGKITDVLCGCKFEISPKSFYQVNSLQTEILYKTAMSFANLTGKETVLDAYCGTGTIGIIASKYAKEVAGVELNPQAVKDAKNNAKLNKRDNIKFFRDDAGDFMRNIAKEEVSAPDVLFVDPPRAGCSRTFLNSAVELSPEKIVYVSCNPQTLTRDLMFLKTNGYEVHNIQPVDMFPHTNHVECVCLITKSK